MMLVPTERNRLLCGTLAQSFPIYLVYRRIVGVIDRVGGRDDWKGGFCGGRSKNGGSWSVG